MTKNFLLALFSLLIIFSNAKALLLMDEPSLEFFERLAGAWETDGENFYHEEWIVDSDNTISGSAYSFRDGKKENPEKLRIHQVNGEIFYTADVSHNPAPVDFKLISLSDSVAVFENLQHDFPQRITYNFQSDDKILAVIEGPGKEGKVKQFGFYLIRKK